MQSVIKSYAHVYTTVITYTLTVCVHERPQECSAICGCVGRVRLASPIDEWYETTFKGIALLIGNCVNTKEYSTCSICASLTSN